MEMYLFHTEDDRGEAIKLFSDKKALHAFLETCYRIKVRRLNEVGIPPEETISKFIYKLFIHGVIRTLDVITESEATKEAGVVMRDYV